MSSEKSKASSGSIGLLSLLGLLFIALKLCGVINWSWWWVTVPLWGGIAIMLVIAFICFIMGIIQLLTQNAKKKARGK